MSESEGKVNSETQTDRGSEDRGPDSQSVDNGTPPRLFGMRKAAEYMGVSYDVLKGYRFRGELPSVKLGRRILIDVRDLDALIEKKKYIEL